MCECGCGQYVNVGVANMTRQDKTKTLFDKNTYELPSFQLPHIVKQTKYTYKKLNNKNNKINKYIYMNILHNWQLKLYTLTFKIYIVCQDPVPRQIAAGIRAQRCTSMETGVNVLVGC